MLLLNVICEKGRLSIEYPTLSLTSSLGIELDPVLSLLSSSHSHY